MTSAKTSRPNPVAESARARFRAAQEAEAAAVGAVHAAGCRGGEGEGEARRRDRSASGGARRSCQRRSQSPPLLAPHVMASQTSVPQSGSFHASVTSRAASEADGGSGFGVGADGGDASSIGFCVIHRQRTARANAPDRIQWIWRILDAAKDRHS
jgi:hypothetical protein